MDLRLRDDKGILSSSGMLVDDPPGFKLKGTGEYDDGGLCEDADRVMRDIDGVDI